MLSTLVNHYRAFLIFLMLAAIVTVICGIIYATVQQTYRTEANDPQIEISETVADFLKQGAPPEAIIGQNRAIDIAKSLSVFVLLFDKDGKAQTGSGKLGDSFPVPPPGVFDYARKHGEDRLTWQPQKDVRLATVVRKADDDKGFVLAARNMREVEIREKRLSIMVGIAWAMLLILSAILAKTLSRVTKEITVVEETNILNLEK